MAQYTIQQFAAKHGVSRATVRKWVERTQNGKRGGVEIKEIDTTPPPSETNPNPTRRVKVIITSEARPAHLEQSRRAKTGPKPRPVAPSPPESGPVAGFTPRRVSRWPF